MIPPASPASARVRALAGPFRTAPPEGAAKTPDGLAGCHEAPADLSQQDALVARQEAEPPPLGDDLHLGSRPETRAFAQRLGDEDAAEAVDGRRLGPGHGRSVARAARVGNDETFASASCIRERPRIDEDRATTGKRSGCCKARARAPPPGDLYSTSSTSC